MNNPFPGPQPYRASDQARFFGREDLALELGGNVVANRCVTVYGPSGAGKSSLMQASVIPTLVASHGIRTVRIDGWPEGEDPTRWLSSTVYSHLDLGEVPADLAPGEAIMQAAQRAARRSSRLLLVYLDQIEQLLYTTRPTAAVDAFFEHVQTLVNLPIRNARVVLSLREDYLGRFRDRLRDRGRLLENGFRVGPLTVAELCTAVCQAAGSGEPPQIWSLEQTRDVILQVRAPGEPATDTAEAQAAYAQIVCRALFQERERARAASTTLELSEVIERSGIEAKVAVKAELILHRYLDVTLDHLGPLAPEARRLLEDHLVTADGSRTLRTENELLRIMPQEKLQPILSALEGAAILHAEAHQGSRYFEFGHDWLARKVYEQRQQRERAEEDQRRAAEQEEALRKQRAEADERLARARRQRRLLAIVALVAVFVATGAAAMSVWALREQEKAMDAGLRAEAARRAADDKAIEASDARLLAGFRELKNSGQLAWGTKLLPEVQRPAQARGWSALASDALRTSVLERTLHGHDRALSAAAFSPDGQRLLTASLDGSARISSADGSGKPVLLRHGKPITLATWSPDGRRVLTASVGGTVRLWNADGTGFPVELDGHAGPVIAAAFSSDGKRVVVASRDDAIARVWSADGGGLLEELKGHVGPLTGAVFHPDGERVLTSSEDGTARLWILGSGRRPAVFNPKKGPVVFVAPSPDGTSILTISRSGSVSIWDAAAKGKLVVLVGHDGPVNYAAWSPDSKRVATASADRTARIWSADGTGVPVVLKDHAGDVTFVSFRPDGRYVATASADRTARVWPVEGGTPLVLHGHEAPVRQVTWSPDGSRVLTATGAAEKGTGSSDYTARIWRTTLLDSLPRSRAAFFHSAFIDPRGKFVVSAYDDRRARLWSVNGKDATVIFEGHKDWVASAALSADGKRVVTASFDDTARLWGADGTLLRELRGHTRPVRAAAWSPDGKRVVTASDDGTARLWSADGTGEPVVLRGHTDALTSASWSPDGQRLVTTALDDTARLYRADGTFERALEGHGGDVFSAAFRPDGQRLVTVSEDGTAQIWDAATGAPVVMLDHRSPVVCATFSPDGARLATSSADGAVRLWSAEGKGDPVVLEARAPLIALTFLDEGRRLFGVGADNTTYAWTLDIGALREGLAATNADCLPAEMRATYFIEPRDEAAKRFAACEAAHGRVDLRAVPLLVADDDTAQAPRGPKVTVGADARRAGVSAGERRIPVFVLPGDAAVEVDSKLIRRRDGVVEVLVKLGGEKHLKATMGLTGTRLLEKWATVQEVAAGPTVVDLNEKPPPGALWNSAKPARFGFDE